MNWQIMENKRSLILFVCMVMATMAAHTPFGLAAQDYYSGRKSAKGNSITFGIENHPYSKVALLYDINDPTYKNAAHNIHTGDPVPIPYPYYAEAQRIDLIRMVEQTFTSSEIIKYSKSQEEIEIDLKFDPTTGKVIGMTFCLNYTKNLILLGIPPTKFESLQKIIKENYVQRNIPTKTYSHLVTFFSFKFSDLEAGAD